MRRISLFIICLLLLLCCLGTAMAEEWSPQFVNWESSAYTFKTKNSEDGQPVQSSHLNTVMTVQAVKNGRSQIAATTAGDYSFSVNTDQLPSGVSQLTIRVYRYLGDEAHPLQTNELIFPSGQGIVTKCVDHVMAGQQLIWTQSINSDSYQLMINSADFSGTKDEPVAAAAVETAETAVADGDRLTGSPILTGTPAVGDTFYMGWYEQDNDRTNGRERIEWTVLDVNRNKGTVLVISSLALDCKIYHPVRAAVPWGQTYLRNWLAGTFTYSALNEREQACILPQKVAGVTDYVTMLDETQIAKYHLNDNGCDVSEYALNLDQPVNINDEGKGCWWVRMDKTNASFKIKFVGRGGTIYAASKTDKAKKLTKKGGNYTTSKDNGVRPAMLLSISALQSTMLEDDFAVLTGSVVNASNPTQKISGVKVTVDGRTYTTDSNGEFVAGVNIGPVTYTVEDSQYITVTDTLQITGGQQSVTIPISRRMAENEYRVVLTWGANPSDLDSHLLGQTESGSSYHVAYYSLRADNSKALLEWDDTTSYGPETTHFFAYPGKTYTFCVHDYTNRSSSSSRAMGDSGAKVIVYRGDAMIASYEIPTGSGTVWNVFTVYNNEIQPVDTMTYCNDPRAVGR